MYSFHLISFEDLELIDTRHSLFLDKYSYRQEEGALLPSEFIASFIELVRPRPQWIGFACLSDDLILGTGMYKHEPIDGMVEIGYGVAPNAEGQGVATSIVSQ